MTLGLRPRMAIASGVLVAVVGGSFGALLAATHDLTGLNAERRRLDRVIVQANLVEKLVLDLETGQRGYLIVHEQRFLQPWVAARAELPRQAAALVRLTQARDQRLLATAIRRDALAYLRRYSEPLVRTAVLGGLADARARVQTGEGKRRVDALREQFERFLESERALVAAHERVADGRSALVVRLGVAALAASLALVLAFGVWLARTVVRPIRRAAAAAGRLGAGDLGTRLPETEAAEVGALARAFNAMGRALEESRDELGSQNEELEQQQAELEQALAELAEEKTRVEGLYGLSSRLARESGADAVAAVALREIADVARAEVGACWVAAEAGGYRLAAARGVERGALAPDLVEGSGLAGRAAAERRTLVADHGDTSLRLPGLGGEIAVRHEAHLPLVHGERCVGVLAIGRAAGRPFGDVERERLARLVSQAAVAVARALAFEHAVDVGRLNQVVLEAAADAISLVAADGTTLLENRALRTLVDGLAQPDGAGAVRGGAFASLSSDPVRFVAELEDALADEEDERVDEFALRDGRTFVRWSAPVRDAAGAYAGRIFTLREVTAERAVERLKDEFVATVSHELRTPLTSIMGYLELVLGGEAGELTDDQRRFLGVVDRSAERLLHLVGDLLFVAQAEAGRLALDRAPVDLPAVAQAAVEAARPAALEAGVDLALECGPTPVLHGDEKRLEQLLANLLSNAFKFTPGGGSVRVAVRGEGSRAVVEVADSGIGIAEADADRLFERFFRAASATKSEIPGTGLGLAIAKTIVDAHGGDIRVASREGAGTTFRIELPAFARTAAKEAA